MRRRKQMLVALFVFCGMAGVAQAQLKTSVYAARLGPNGRAFISQPYANQNGG